MKVAGHRLGTGEMEAFVSENTNVAEVSCIGVSYEVKGQVPIVVIVLKADVKGNDELKEEISDLIRKEIGPVATPKAVYFAKALPKTRSGKVIRRAIKNIAEGKYPGDLSTIENPATIDQIKNLMHEAS